MISALYVFALFFLFPLYSFTALQEISHFSFTFANNFPLLLHPCKITSHSSITLAKKLPTPPSPLQNNLPVLLLLLFLLHLLIFLFHPSKLFCCFEPLLGGAEWCIFVPQQKTLFSVPHTHFAKGKNF